MDSLIFRGYCGASARSGKVRTNRESEGMFCARLHLPRTQQQPHRGEEAGRLEWKLVLRVLSTRPRVARSTRNSISPTLHLETRATPYNTPTGPAISCRAPMAQTSDRTALNNKLFPSCTLNQLQSCLSGTCSLFIIHRRSSRRSSECFEGIGRHRTLSFATLLGSTQTKRFESCILMAKVSTMFFSTACFGTEIYDFQFFNNNDRQEKRRIKYRNYFI